MDAGVRFPRKLLLAIFVLFVLVFLSINAAVYLGLPELIQQIALVAGSPDAAVAGDPFAGIRDRTTVLAAAGTAVGLTLFGLLLWLWQRGAYLRLRATDRPPLKKSKSGAAPRRDAATGGSDNTERLYLHLLAMLQQEGRLVDFLTEDLGAYGDDQIGAAVRSIHANCRTTLEKYLSPRAVIDAAEGAPYTVAPGFDPAQVRLTGNVTGEPPFTGTVRHRGWQAGRVELPTLSGSHGQRILAPAEIEIL